MKILIHSKDLQKKLDHLYKISKNRTAIPILDYFKMDVLESEVSFTASDLEVTMITKVIPETITSIGSTCIKADKFTEVIKNIKDCLLELSTDDKNNLIIKSKSGKFKIPCMDTEDFPILNEPKSDDIISLSSAVIVNSLNKTDFAVYKSELRPILCGVNFDLKVDKTVVYATDGYRVAATFSEPCVSYPCSIVFPTKLSSIIKGIASDSISNVELSFDDKNIKVDLQEYLIYSKRIEGEYVNYEPTLNMETDVIFSANKEEITDAIKRSLTFASEYNLIAISVLIGKISISAEDRDFGLSAEEDVFCENKEGSGIFKVNGRFFLEILQRITSESIELCFSEKTPMVYVNPLDEKENCLFGLMKYA